MCKGEGSVVCLNSCHICAVERILILERNETDLERKVHYLWGYGLFFFGGGVGQTSKSFKAKCELCEKTRFTVGRLDPGPQPEVELASRSA